MFILFGMATKEYIISVLRNQKTELGKYGVKSLGLFGSYVRNEQTPDSDIDLFIEFEPDQENFDNFMAVCDIVEQLFKNQKIEVVTKNGLSQYIGPKILNEVVYV